MFRSDEPPKGVDGVMGNVYFSSNPEVLDALIEEERGPEELRLYLGHSGWAPGQLDNELLRGDWGRRAGGRVHIVPKEDRDDVG